MTVKQLINKLQEVENKDREVRLDLYDNSLNEFFDCEICNATKQEFEDEAVYIHANLFS